MKQKSLLLFAVIKPKEIVLKIIFRAISFYKATGGECRNLFSKMQTRNYVEIRKLSLMK